MSEAPIVVWLRQDLRLADQPALHAAASTCAPVLPVYVLDDESPGRWRMGGASRWWLHGSLSALATAIAALGGRLLLRRGLAMPILLDLVREVGAGAVHWTTHHEPHWQRAEVDLQRALRADGKEGYGFAGATLFPTGSIVGRQGKPIRIFTPFWRACLAAAPPRPPLAAPARLTAPVPFPASDHLESWALRPTRPNWAQGMEATWRPGESSALSGLRRFVDHDLVGYARNRDRPDPAAASRLSAHLHFGEISPHQVWHATLARAAAEPALGVDAEAYLRQLGWREFCAATLQQRPDMADQALRPRFRNFPSVGDPMLLRAWQKGRTGYPFVDAGMRQLWHTGWIPNRVRLIVASFLVKHLLQPWQDGAAWFWDTLVDADLANNAGGWQWAAGCGIDAAPYFRIFNPVSQGERFDAASAYVRRWLPELAQLPDRWIHRPWEAPPLVLTAANVRLGGNYPNPLVEHRQARQRALDAYAAMETAP